MINVRSARGRVAMLKEGEHFDFPVADNTAGSELFDAIFPGSASYRSRGFACEVLLVSDRRVARVRRLTIFEQRPRP